MMAESSKVDSTSASTVPTYTSKPASGSGISLCLSYFRTGPGIVKLIQLVSKLVLICVGINDRYVLIFI